MYICTVQYIYVYLCSMYMVYSYYTSFVLLFCRNFLSGHRKGSSVDIPIEFAVDLFSGAASSHVSYLSSKCNCGYSDSAHWLMFAVRPTATNVVISMLIDGKLVHLKSFPHFQDLHLNLPTDLPDSALYPSYLLSYAIPKDQGPEFFQHLVKLPVATLTNEILCLCKEGTKVSECVSGHHTAHFRGSR